MKRASSSRRLGEERFLHQATHYEDHQHEGEKDINDRPGRNRNEESEQEMLPPSSRRAFLSDTTLALVATTISTLPQTAIAAPTSATGESGKEKQGSRVPSMTSDTSPSSSSSITLSTEVSSTTTPLQESISGFVAGGALTFTKTLVKYPLDTVTVRLQMPGDNSKKDIWKNPFNGIFTPLLFNIPGGAVFFAVKDACKSYLRGNSHWEVSKFVATCISVGIANFPYWVVRNPSEVLKTKQQAASVLISSSSASDLEDEEEAGNAWQLFRREQEENGWAGLYVGYWENIVYAYPADVFKFVLYDQFVSILLSSGATTTTPLQGALAGALATSVAQLLTTPLDVVRNRVMTGVSSLSKGYRTSTGNIGYLEMLQITAAEGALWAGAAPRVGKALLSGAIQFATYEETKRQLADFFFSASTSVTDVSSLGIH